jgi:hypothetical protein
MPSKNAQQPANGWMAGGRKASGMGAVRCFSYERGNDAIHETISLAQLRLPAAARRGDQPGPVFCHVYGRGKGQAQMVLGWPYSLIAALEPGRTSWTAVLDAVRLGPGDDEAEVTAEQVSAGHWPAGGGRTSLTPASGSRPSEARDSLLVAGVAGGGVRWVGSRGGVGRRCMTGC